MELLILLKAYAEVGSLAVSVILLVWAFRFSRTQTDIKHILVGVDKKSGMQGDLEKHEKRLNEQEKAIEHNTIVITGIKARCDLLHKDQ